jgi:hypothetical protein
MLSQDQDAQVRREITAMMARLDAARHESRDLPDGPALEVTWKVKTGRKGRPKQHFDPVWLSQASGLRTNAHVAPLLGCSARTLRRCKLEYKLSNPGLPVSQLEELPDGGHQLVYIGNKTQTSALSDNQVGTIVSSQLQMFPNFGRSMMAGSLQVEGFNIPRQRVRESYDRIQGGPTARFGQRRIHRRAYQVAGPNSLWHHDGQHGRSLCCLHLVPLLIFCRTHQVQACYTRVC